MVCLTRFTWSDKLEYDEWDLWFRLLPHAEMLCKRAEEDTRVEPNAELLYNLGEALEQAAAYIHNQQDPAFGFSAYLPLYQQAEAYYLKQLVSGGDTDYPKSVYATWRTTIEKLSR